MTSGISYETGASTIARQYHVPICRLYDAAFSVSPFAWRAGDSEEHSSVLTQIRQDETFGITVATVEGILVGFAYGHQLPVDHGWWNDFQHPLATEVTTEWPARTFALIDLAVAGQWRTKGIGKGILHRLLTTRKEERAVLSVQPTAVETQHIYQHLGWQKIGSKGPIAGINPPYWDIFVTTLGRFVPAIHDG